jgi:hypothetical protein
MILHQLNQLLKPFPMKIFSGSRHIVGPKRPIYGPFAKKVENLWEKSSHVDDTRSVETTSRASSKENIFGSVWTNLAHFGSKKAHLCSIYHT